jgi:hypothetical protein
MKAPAEQADDRYPLGAPLRKEAAKPEPKHLHGNVWQGVDGKLYTAPLPRDPLPPLPTIEEIP